MKKIHQFDEVFDSQRLYRELLHAFANPTCKKDIRPFAEKLPSSHPEFLAFALTLLDNEVQFSTCGQAELTEQILSLTLSVQAEVSSAAYIFVPARTELASAIAAAMGGTLADPHLSATLLVKTSAKNQQRVKLSGPGMRVPVTLSVDEEVKLALDLRDQRYDEYPQGIDFVFIDNESHYFAIPRLIRQEAC